MTCGIIVLIFHLSDKRFKMARHFLRSRCFLLFVALLGIPLSSFAQGLGDDPAPAPPESEGIAVPARPVDGDLDTLLRDLQQRIDSVENENRTLRDRLDGLSSGGAKKDEGSPLDMKASWNNGLELKSKDKKFKVHIGGRTQFDMAFFDASSAVETGPNSVGPIQDGVDFRRARIKIDGTMYDFIEWACQFDFSNTTNDDPTVAANQSNVINVPVPTDLWTNFSHVPIVGNIRVGNFKEYIGFEHLTSSRYLNFMERSYNQDAFTGPFNNGFTPGIGIWNTALEDDRATWGIGLFKNNSNGFGWGLGDGEYAVTGRATALLRYENEGEELVHIGAAYSHRDTDNDVLRIRARGSVRGGPGTLWPSYANTGTMIADTQDLFGAEFVVVHGPWTLQSEYMASVASNVVTGGIDRGNATFQGGYGEILYFLTGEHQNYNKKSGAFDRTIPCENFSLADGAQCRGWGAWQAGVRYNFLDLNDSGVNGNILNTVVFGLNWFMNPNVKVQWNYDITKRNTVGPGGDGYIHAFGTRLAYDF